MNTLCPGVGKPKFNFDKVIETGKDLLGIETPVSLEQKFVENLGLKKADYLIQKDKLIIYADKTEVEKIMQKNQEKFLGTMLKIDPAHKNGNGLQSDNVFYVNKKSYSTNFNIEFRQKPPSQQTLIDEAEFLGLSEKRVKTQTPLEKSIQSSAFVFLKLMGHKEEFSQRNIETTFFSDEAAKQKPEERDKNIRIVSKRIGTLINSHNKKEIRNAVSYLNKKGLLFEAVKEYNNAIAFQSGILEGFSHISDNEIRDALFQKTQPTLEQIIYVSKTGETLAGNFSEIAQGIGRIKEKEVALTFIEKTDLNPILKDKQQSTDFKNFISSGINKLGADHAIELIKEQAINPILEQNKAAFFAHNAEKYLPNTPVTIQAKIAGMLWTWAKTRVEKEALPLAVIINAGQLETQKIRRVTENLFVVNTLSGSYEIKLAGEDIEVKAVPSLAETPSNSKTTLTQRQRKTPETSTTLEETQIPKSTLDRRANDFDDLGREGEIGTITWEQKQSRKNLKPAKEKDNLLADTNKAMPEQAPEHGFGLISSPEEARTAAGILYELIIWASKPVGKEQKPLADLIKNELAVTLGAEEATVYLGKQILLQASDKYSVNNDLQLKIRVNKKTIILNTTAGAYEAGIINGRIQVKTVPALPEDANTKTQTRQPSDRNTFFTTPFSPEDETTNFWDKATRSQNETESMLRKGIWFVGSEPAVIETSRENNKTNYAILKRIGKKELVLVRNGVYQIRNIKVVDENLEIKTSEEIVRTSIESFSKALPDNPYGIGKETKTKEAMSLGRKHAEKTYLSLVLSAYASEYSSISNHIIDRFKEKNISVGPSFTPTISKIVLYLIKQRTPQQGAVTSRLIAEKHKIGQIAYEKREILLSVRDFEATLEGYEKEEWNAIKTVTTLQKIYDECVSEESYQKEKNLMRENLITQNPFAYVREYYLQEFADLSNYVYGKISSVSAHDTNMMSWLIIYITQQRENKKEISDSDFIKKFIPDEKTTDWEWQVFNDWKQKITPNGELTQAINQKIFSEETNLPRITPARKQFLISPFDPADKEGKFLELGARGIKKPSGQARSGEYFIPLFGRDRIDGFIELLSSFGFAALRKPMTWDNRENGFLITNVDLFLGIISKNAQTFEESRYLRRLGNKAEADRNRSNKKLVIEDGLGNYFVTAYNDYGASRHNGVILKTNPPAENTFEDIVKILQGDKPSASKEKIGVMPYAEILSTAFGKEPELMALAAGKLYAEYPDAYPELDGFHTLTDLLKKLENDEIEYLITNYKIIDLLNTENIARRALEQKTGTKSWDSIQHIISELGFDEKHSLADLRNRNNKPLGDDSAMLDLGGILGRINGLFTSKKSEDLRSIKADILYAAALRYLESGDYKQATIYYAEISGRHALNVRAFKGLGSSLLMMGEYAGAAKMFALTLDRNRDDLDAKLGRGIINLIAGDKIKASVDLSDEELSKTVGELKETLKQKIIASQRGKKQAINQEIIKPETNLHSFVSLEIINRADNVCNIVSSEAARVIGGKVTEQSLEARNLIGGLQRSLTELKNSRTPEHLFSFMAEIQKLENYLKDEKTRSAAISFMEEGFREIRKTTPKEEIEKQINNISGNRGKTNKFDNESGMATPLDFVANISRGIGKVKGVINPGPAAKASAEPSNSRAIDPLIKEVDDYSRDVAKDAVMDLVKMGHLATDYLLIPTTGKNHLRSYQARLRLESALERLEDSSGIDSLISAFGNDNTHDIIRVINKLGASGDVQAVEPLIAALKNIQNNFALSASEAQARSSRFETKSLIRNLKIINDKVIISVIRALGELGDVRAVEPLIEFLGSDNEGIVITVINVLGELEDGRAVIPLINTFAKYPEKPPNVAQRYEPPNFRLRIVNALGDIGDARATDLLTQALNDYDNDIRKAAAVALNQIKRKNPDPKEKTKAGLNEDAMFTPLEGVGNILGKVSGLRHKHHISKATVDYSLVGEILRDNYEVIFLNNGVVREDILPGTGKLVELFGKDSVKRLLENDKKNNYSGFTELCSELEINSLLKLSNALGSIDELGEAIENKPRDVAWVLAILKQYEVNIEKFKEKTSYHKTASLDLFKLYCETREQEIWLEEEGNYPRILKERLDRGGWQAFDQPARLVIRRKSRDERIIDQAKLEYRESSTGSVLLVDNDVFQIKEIHVGGGKYLEIQTVEGARIEVSKETFRKAFPENPYGIREETEVKKAMSRELPPMPSQISQFIEERIGNINNGGTVKNLIYNLFIDLPKNGSPERPTAEELIRDIVLYVIDREINSEGGLVILSNSEFVKGLSEEKRNRWTEWTEKVEAEGEKLDIKKFMLLPGDAERLRQIPEEEIKQALNAKESTGPIETPSSKRLNFFTPFSDETAKQIANSTGFVGLSPSVVSRETVVKAVDEINEFFGSPLGGEQFNKAVDRALTLENDFIIKFLEKKNVLDYASDYYVKRTTAYVLAYIAIKQLMAQIRSEEIITTNIEFREFLEDARKKGLIYAGIQPVFGKWTNSRRYPQYGLNLSGYGQLGIGGIGASNTTYKGFSPREIARMIRKTDIKAAVDSTLEVFNSGKSDDFRKEFFFGVEKHLESDGSFARFRSALANAENRKNIVSARPEVGEVVYKLSFGVDETTSFSALLNEYNLLYALSAEGGAPIIGFSANGKKALELVLKSRSSNAFADFSRAKFIKEINDKKTADTLSKKGALVFNRKGKYFILVRKKASKGKNKKLGEDAMITPMEFISNVKKIVLGSSAIDWAKIDSLPDENKVAGAVLDGAVRAVRSKHAKKVFSEASSKILVSDKDWEEAYLLKNFVAPGLNKLGVLKARKATLELVLELVKNKAKSEEFKEYPWMFITAPELRAEVASAAARLDVTYKELALAYKEMGWFTLWKGEYTHSVYELIKESKGRGGVLFTKLLPAVKHIVKYSTLLNIGRNLLSLLSRSEKEGVSVEELVKLLKNNKSRIKNGYVLLKVGNSLLDDLKPKDAPKIIEVNDSVVEEENTPGLRGELLKLERLRSIIDNKYLNERNLPEREKLRNELRDIDEAIVEVNKIIGRLGLGERKAASIAQPKVISLDEFNALKADYLSGKIPVDGLYDSLVNLFHTSFQENLGYSGMVSLFLENALVRLYALDEKSDEKVKGTISRLRKTTIGAETRINNLGTPIQRASNLWENAKQSLYYLSKYDDSKLYPIIGYLFAAQAILSEGAHKTRMGERLNEVLRSVYVRGDGVEEKIQKQISPLEGEAKNKALTHWSDVKKYYAGLMGAQITSFDNFYPENHLVGEYAKQTAKNSAFIDSLIWKQAQLTDFQRFYLSSLIKSWIRGMELVGDARDGGAINSLSFDFGKKEFTAVLEMNVLDRKTSEMKYVKLTRKATLSILLEEFGFGNIISEDFEELVTTDMSFAGQNQKQNDYRMKLFLSAQEKSPDKISVTETIYGVHISIQSGGKSIDKIFAQDFVLSPEEEELLEGAQNLRDSYNKLSALRTNIDNEILRLDKLVGKSVFRHREKNYQELVAISRHLSTELRKPENIDSKYIAREIEDRILSARIKHGYIGGGEQKIEAFRERIILSRKNLIIISTTILNEARDERTKKIINGATSSRKSDLGPQEAASRRRKPFDSESASLDIFGVRNPFKKQGVEESSQTGFAQSNKLTVLTDEEIDSLVKTNLSGLENLDKTLVARIIITAADKENIVNSDWSLHVLGRWFRKRYELSKINAPKEINESLDLVLGNLPAQLSEKDVRLAALDARIVGALRKGFKNHGFETFGGYIEEHNDELIALFDRKLQISDEESKNYVVKALIDSCIMELRKRPSDSGEWISITELIPQFPMDEAAHYYVIAEELLEVLEVGENSPPHIKARVAGAGEWRKKGYSIENYRAELRDRYLFRAKQGVERSGGVLENVASRIRVKRAAEKTRTEPAKVSNENIISIEDLFSGEPDLLKRFKDFEAKLGSDAINEILAENPLVLREVVRIYQVNHFGWVLEKLRKQKGVSEPEILYQAYVLYTEYKQRGSSNVSKDVLGLLDEWESKNFEFEVARNVMDFSVNLGIRSIARKTSGEYGRFAFLKDLAEITSSQKARIETVRNSRLRKIGLGNELGGIFVKASDINSSKVHLTVFGRHRLESEEVDDWLGKKLDRAEFNKGNRSRALSHNWDTTYYPEKVKEAVFLLMELDELLSDKKLPDSWLINPVGIGGRNIVLSEFKESAESFIADNRLQPYADAIKNINLNPVPGTYRTPDLNDGSRRVDTYLKKVALTVEGRQIIEAMGKKITDSSAARMAAYLQGYGIGHEKAEGIGRRVTNITGSQFNHHILSEGMVVQYVSRLKVFSEAFPIIYGLKKLSELSGKSIKELVPLVYLQPLFGLDSVDAETMAELEVILELMDELIAERGKEYDISLVGVLSKLSLEAILLPKDALMPYDYEARIARIAGDAELEKKVLENAEKEIDSALAEFEALVKQYGADELLGRSDLVDKGKVFKAMMTFGTAIDEGKVAGKSKEYLIQIFTVIDGKTSGGLIYTMMKLFEDICPG